MDINALLMDSTDNVVTCMTEVPAGGQAVYRNGDTICNITAKENIPYCHKVALNPIPKGGHVIKYGESLGTVSEDIPAGGWVADHNLFSVPRDYDSELASDNFKMCAKQSEGAPDLKPFQFWGYRRAEGRPGIRNHVLILPTCACGSESCRIVASQVRGAVNIIFNTGCSDVAANTAMSQKVLTGFACSPNVYGVVIIGLGCETVPHNKLREKIQSMTSKPVVSFGIQDEGGTLKTIEKAVRAARDMAAEAAMQQKELFDISEFLMGIECGGSDATSGIASNPAVGELSDILVDMGATTMMSESIEWIGGEHVLAKRAANKEIHDQITRPVVEVLEQGVRPSKHGAIVMDTAGYDISSVTSMAAAGCQAIIFTTGRGTPTGNAIVPVLKVTANGRTYQKMEDNMDIDLSPIVRGEKTYQEMGREMVDAIRDICNGKMTKAEAFGFSDIAVDHVCRFV